ncbi:hypothetical protein DM860_016911 [Cuscuta australis]|uniref:Pentacotripeptide-repeat region of PRORP domain-containing protein n=1 Tax=Cuscuta australis TaxID=267555 RepID=A0A328DXI0_9ASTE|nr:hypothetical protein DM860_016911 [Cuscuta australis]
MAVSFSCGRRFAISAKPSRNLSALASQASLAITNQSEQSRISSRPSKRGSSKSSSGSQSGSRLAENSIDILHISEILSRKDWYLLLNHEFRAKRVNLNPRLIVSVLQNQEDPLLPVRFYTWVSNININFSKNQSIRSVLANVLYRKGPVLLSAGLVQDIQDSGHRVNEDLLCVLIGSWGRLGLAKYSAEILEQVSFLGLNPTTRLYNAVIDASVKSNSLDLAYLKFQQMRADGCVPDRFTYNILIHGVCKAGLMEEAIRLVKQMEEGSRYSPNVFTYTSLVDGFCNAGRVKDAFQMIETMKGRNVIPNEATLRALVGGVFRHSPPLDAFEMLYGWLEKEPVLPKVACDAILNCLCDNSLPTVAGEFLRESLTRGYLPDNQTFNSVVICLIKGLEIEVICQKLEFFNGRGLKMGFDAYLLLVGTLYQKGRVEEGNLYVDQMFQEGLVSNTFSYNMLIHCFCKNKMMDRASKTFQDMIDGGTNIQPNLVTSNTLIDGHCKLGDITRARKLLEMLLEKGLKPDAFTFTSIIDGLCRAHRIEDAFGCFTEMEEWGVSPSATTYNVLIRALCARGEVRRSVELLKKMEEGVGVRGDVFSYNALIQGLCRVNEIEKGKRVLKTMSRLGLRPDNYTYSAFIKALCRLGRFDEAKALFGSMEVNGCVPDAHTCNSFIDMLVQSSRLEEAKQIFVNFSKRGIPLEPIKITTT